MARIKPTAEKSPKTAPGTSFPLQRFRGSVATRLALAAVILGGLTYYARLVWLGLRNDVAHAEPYRLTVDRIEITPPPEWIRSDIKAEIIRDGSLDGPTSLLDDRLAQRIHTAALLHPWVANAEVRLHYPAKVAIDIEYRRPVAMIEVPGGLLPVDRHGVVLRTDDFSPSDTKRYPRVSGITSGAAGVGAEWGDSLVNDAALVAAELATIWNELELFSIVPTAGASPGEPRQWQITAKAGWRADWGHAPGKEREGEPSAADKVARLQQAAISHAAKLPGEIIDLRNKTEFAHQPDSGKRLQ